MACQVWQISAGPVTRSYTDVFLKYGVGLIGPGDSGPWVPERYAHDYSLQGFVGRFATEVNTGDIFLLRTGLSKISAIGIVASDYMYLNQFEDVNGWDLQHARRVRWCKLPDEYEFGEPLFGANPTRISRVNVGKIVDIAERFVNSPPTQWQTNPLPPLPSEEPPLEEVPNTLQGMIAQANDLVPLFWDRHGFGDHPSEDELIVHFIVPFLRTLGWPPEQIAIKWRHIDVAVFRALPRTPENCQFVIEAKRLGAGVEGALEQAKGYIESLGVPRDIILTDGIRYRMYSCQNDFNSIAYANLTRLKASATDLFARMKRP